MPWSENREIGLVVPIPTLPVLVTIRNVVCAPVILVEPIAKSVVSDDVEAASTESSAYGDVEPTPTAPPTNDADTELAAVVEAAKTESGPLLKIPP